MTPDEMGAAAAKALPDLSVRERRLVARRVAKIRALEADVRNELAEILGLLTNVVRDNPPTAERVAIVKALSEALVLLDAARERKR